MKGLVPLAAVLALIVAQMLTPASVPQQEIKSFWLSVYTYDLPTGLLTDGNHTYRFQFNYSAPQPGSLDGQVHSIQVSSQAPVAEANVLIRPAGLQGLNTVSDCAELQKVNPSQPVKFMIAWVPNVSMTEADFKAQVQSMKATVQWDNRPPAPLTLQTSTTSWDPLWNCRPWVYDPDPHIVTSGLDAQ